jgi:urea carboxylase
VKFKPIDETEYRRIRAEVDAGTFRYRQAPIAFDLGEALTDPDGYKSSLLEALNGI